MSSTGSKEALSHLLVAGTTLWCVFHIDKSTIKWEHLSYGALCVYSVVGLWRYGNPRYGDNAADAYATATVAQQCLTLPGIVTQLYINYGHDPHLMPVHAVLPMIPLATYLAQGEPNQDITDLLMAINCISTGVISVIQQNYYGVASAVNYFMNHFILRFEEFDRVPTVVLYNIGLAFFTYFSFRALADAHKL